MQHEIIKKHELLDTNGNLIEPGFARSLLLTYNKKTDLKSKLRTKEWDYYLICNEHYGLALTLADNGYMGLDSISLLDFDKKWEVTKSPMQFLTLGKKNFPITSATGDIEYGDKNYHLSFKHQNDKRILQGFMNNFIGDKKIEFEITLSNEPKESMVICTPFNKEGHFYYNQKINCMNAQGYVKCGLLNIEFKPNESFGVLDWGRGIWTYSNTWYWSSLSTMVNNQKFGFNLGYGFGDTSAASENVLFYGDKVHKLDKVSFNIPTNKKGKCLFTDKWTFTSNDKRLNLEFVPIIDRQSNTNALIIQSDQHQVFGRFYGTCILDNGEEIKLDGNLGFAEKVKNRW